MKNKVEIDIVEFIFNSFYDFLEDNPLQDEEGQNVLYNKLQEIMNKKQKALFWDYHTTEEAYREREEKFLIQFVIDIIKSLNK